MASNPSTNLTARDYQILSFLIKTPLDARQLLKLSAVFEEPFTCDRLVRRRLQQLVNCGLVSCFSYAVAGAGSLNYYKATPAGYRLIQGPDAPIAVTKLLSRDVFVVTGALASLADFIVHVHTSAMAAGVEVESFYRENQLLLTLDDRKQQPDCAFQLKLRDGRSFNYVVEMDCGTEPIRSTKQRESLEAKIRFYDEYQDAIRKRFRVLVLFTKPSVRMTHFCEAADEVIQHPQRTLILATSLPHFLERDDTLKRPVFLDRRQELNSLIPRPRENTETAAIS